METKEKKVYQQPRMEAVEVKMQGHLLTQSNEVLSRENEYNNDLGL